ncbi:MAG: hypothetical protein QOE70_1465 [Chthoniobacter sp.]|jgi:uncharacterized coiled-coil DUF342 family protein|nr:hypothetical protein [Chthoniobacter sp.]
MRLHHQSILRSRLSALLCLTIASSAIVAAAAADDIDFNRARELYQKSQRGQSLTSDEQTYLERAKEAKRKESESQPAAKSDGDIDMRRAKELHEKSQRGETLAPDDQAYLERAMKWREQRMKALADGQGIDWEKAQQIYQKSQRGETLTPEEQAYLDKAKQARGEKPSANPAAGKDASGSNLDMHRARELFARSQRGEQLTADERAFLEKAKAAMQQGGGARGGPVPEAKSETGLAPLTDLAEKYQGQDGGLYGQGQNQPPPELAKTAQAETARIQPLDAEGKPSSSGKIVLLSIGMSNTTQEFSKFVQLANPDTEKAANVVLVDGAQGGQTADRIADESAQFWSVIDQRLTASGVTPKQVEVVWLKEANAGPSGGFPAATEHLKDALAQDVAIAKRRYPNLRIAYLSSRIYAGYATTALNPEPYAYEGALAVRWLIQDQMKGEPKLNANPAKGEVKAPLLLWGPYLWADGVKGRKAGDLVWKREDFGSDGTHPSESGRQKVAEQLLKFFKTDPNTRTWFVKK